MKGDDEVIFEAIVDCCEDYALVEDLEKYLAGRTASERDAILKNARFGPLGSDLLRQLFLHESPLSLVVTAHLFFEAFLEEIIRRKFPHCEILFKRRDFSYSLKLDLLRAKGSLDAAIYNDLRLLGNLRNKFAHNLEFSLAEFDFTRFTYCKEIYRESAWDWAEGHVRINLYLLRHILQLLLMRLTERHPFIVELKSSYAQDETYEADHDDDDEIPL